MEVKFKVETKKSRVFSHKLIALFLAVLMALSSFTGALTAFAASNANDKNYHDDNLAANFMTWAETTDEQTAEALLDWADLYLDDLIMGLNLNVDLGGVGTIKGDHISIKLNYVVVNINLDGYLDSVDGIFALLQQVDDVLDQYGGTLGGDIKNVNLNAVGDDLTPKAGGATISKSGKAYRANYSAKELVMALAKFLYQNTNDFGGKNVIGQFIKGNFNLGTILQGIVKLDLYSLLKEPLGLWDGYQSNLAYNIVANLMLTNTKWFTEQETSTYYADLQASTRNYAWNFDTVLIKALNEQLLNQIHVEVTYNNMVTITEDDGSTRLVNDSSVRRYRRIVERMQATNDEITIDNANAPANMAAFNAAAAADAAANHYTINDKIKYFSKATANESATADFSLDTGCVYLFQYIDNTTPVQLDVNDNLFSFAFEALEVAWKTVLKDTLGLVHVNYDVDRGNGANFDNQFYYWVEENGGWNRSNWKANYSAANVEAWAADVYEEYNAASASEFLANVKHTYDYDRNVVDDAKNNWQDIDSTTLFNKLRYNPLADLYFDIQTGPINLYFSQTGTAPLETFFQTAFTSYDNMVAGLNDALVAVTEFIFMDSDNIGYGSTGSDNNRKPTENMTVPTMATTGNTIDKHTIASTLVGNIMDMFEYAANVTDANILNPYYANNGIATKADNLSETNFEEAMIPLLVACLQNIVMTEPIHNEKWDSCKDAEGVAIVALEEYLSYLLPEKDYSILWTTDADGYIVAGSTDVDRDGKVDLFNDAILPMCRDAASLWLQAIVPCRDKSWNEWDVYEREVTDPTTLLDILNSIVVYYVGYDAAAAPKDQGKAVASLLGVVDASGNCLVTKDNTIWENIDNIINAILPAIGTAEFGTTDKWGQADSKTLLWDDLVSGILNIGDVRDSFNAQGITNILERLITIITSAPVSNNNGKANMLVMIYDLVADVLNGLFGARYTGQGYQNVIPYAEWYDKDAYNDTHTATPFDSLLTLNTLGYYSVANGKQDSNATGILGILICNIYEAFGGANYNNNGTKGCWVGAMFAVEAVNNFIPSFVPQIGDHTFSAASATIDKPSQSNLTSGSAFDTTTLKIKNNAMGLNRFWRDAAGNINQDGRYFMNVKNVSVASSTGNASNITLSKTSGTIAPEGTLDVQVSGRAATGEQLCTFTVTYDIYEAKGVKNAIPAQTTANTVKSDLTTTAYMYLTTAQDWAGSLYTRDYTDSYNNSGTYKMYDGSQEPNYSNNTTLVTSSARGGKNNKLFASFPKDFIVKMSDPSAIYNYGLRVKNNTSSVSGSEASYDGVYTYLNTGDQYYAVSNGTVSTTLTTASADNDTMAYAAIDRETGNILNYDLYDFYNPLTGDWDRGTKCADSTSYDGGTYSTKNQYQGYTQAEIDALSDSITGGEGFKTRPHVVLTFDEGVASGLVKGVYREKAAVVDGVQTYVYSRVLVTPNVLLLVNQQHQNGKYSISFGTPTPGLYLCASKVKIPKGKTHYTRFLAYDGITPLEQDEYDMKVDVYTSSVNNMKGTIKMHIADDSGAVTLQRSYDESLKAASTYRPNDFTDYANGTSQTYNDMQNALVEAVKAVSTPVNGTNASTLGSKMETIAVTYNTTATSHKDIAYKPLPITEALPSSMQISATKGGDGYWYANDEQTVPIYSNQEVTASDVTRGKLANGDEVVLGDDGKYHLVNTPVYETEWDTTTYSAPYKATTEVQSTNNAEEPLYGEINFVYRDAEGNKVNSTDDWVYKVAETTERIKPNNGATENRGVYQLEVDRTAYYYEQLRAHVNTAIADDIGVGVKEFREDMNNVNYRVASYEKMVQIGHDAEDLIWTEEDKDQSYDYVIDENTGEEIVVTLSNASTQFDTLYQDEAGNLYKDSKVKHHGVNVYATDRSSLEVEFAVSMFNRFYGRIQPRGYQGDKLEAEILCASDYAYTALDYTIEDVKNDDGKREEITAATVTSSTATDAEYGAWVDGTLVNEGEILYTDESWDAYIKALAEAIETADAQDAEISDIYSVKTALQIAENNLEEVKAEEPTDTITISGKLTIATNLDGTTDNGGIIGLNVELADGTVVATSAKDGSFTAEVPAGTTTLKITGPTAITRTVTLTGTANVSNVNIPVCVCDYNPDGGVNGADTALFGGSFSSYNVYADLNPDGGINGADTAIYGIFFGKTVAYAALALD